MMKASRKCVLTQNKDEKSEDYSKADLKQRVLFFITIFRLAIPAFFRFTDVIKNISLLNGLKFYFLVLVFL